MQYIQKQTFNIEELVPIDTLAHVIAISEPEQYLAKLYEKYLQPYSFEVIHCYQGELLAMFVERHNPKVLLLSTDNPEIHGMIEVLRQRNPHLLLVTIAYNAGAEDIRKFMSLGASSHINRMLSRPQDVADIIKGLVK